MIRNILLLYFIFISHFVFAERTIYIFIERNIEESNDSQIRNKYKNSKQKLLNVINKYNIIPLNGGFITDFTFKVLNDIDDINEKVKFLNKERLIDQNKSKEPNFYITFNLVGKKNASRKIEIIRVQLFQLRSQVSFPLCDIIGNDDIENFSKDLFLWFDNRYPANTKLILPNYTDEHFNIKQFKERIENHASIRNKFNIEIPHYPISIDDLKNEYSNCKKIYVFTYENDQSKIDVRVYEAYSGRPHYLEKREESIIAKSPLDEIISKTVKILMKLN